MDVIRPVTITADKLVTSNVPETDHPQWASATVYAKGARCIREHRIWQSAQDANAGHDPAAPGSESWWSEVGATNRFAMFDARVGTQTRAHDEIKCTLRPGRINTLALLNISASSVEVIMRSGSEIVYQRTASMVDSEGGTSWYDYFYEPIRERQDVVFDDLPVMGSATLDVVISRPSGDVACGLLSAGLSSHLGRVLREAKISITDYSKVSDDGFGGLNLTRGEWAKRAEVRMIIPSREVDRIQSLIAELRATPVVWVGAKNLYQSLVIYGKYDDFAIDIAYKTISYCTLTIRGLI